MKKKKMKKKIKITFINPDGKPDFEIVEDLWNASRALRPSLPRYSELKEVEVEVTEVAHD